MIMLTGFDCASFSSLCSMFTPVFDSYTPFLPSGTSCFEREKQPEKGGVKEDLLRRLSWTYFSMDQDKGIIDGIAAHFWYDLLKS
jgi:hypothetical protein